ncbi:MAG: PspA/IM30 family protein, partial [Spirochaetaceae bacterium]
EHLPMIEAPDLSDLDPKDAKRIVLDYIVTLKKTRAKRDELREEFEHWERRYTLATEKGENELAEQALARARTAVEEHERLGAEERELEVVIDTLRNQLRSLEGRPRRRVDADALLSQLEGVLEPDYRTRDAAEELEAQEQLNQLKQRLAEDEE